MFQKRTAELIEYRLIDGNGEDREERGRKSSSFSIAQTISSVRQSERVWEMESYSRDWVLSGKEAAVLARPKTENQSTHFPSGRE